MMPEWAEQEHRQLKSVQREAVIRQIKKPRRMAGVI